MTDTMEKWMAYKKKLIEVALPLDAINKACVREKSIRHGHPSTLHLWWARRPLAAARAVIFAQMVDDPSGHPNKFPTVETQEKERQRLFRLIEELVQWENTTNEDVLERAREEIRKSWRMTCAENQDHPRASELFDPEKLPGFHDPFAGGGALPLEAQRLGLESYASDLNPVAVLINKAMIEIPPKFAGCAPVNPDRCKEKLDISEKWRGVTGLAEDIRHYGQWMRKEAEQRIGHLYPKVEITESMAQEQLSLKGLVGQKLTIISWLWTRTVKSPNPAFDHVDVPLVASFRLSTKKGKEAWVEPVIRKDKSNYDFMVRVGGEPTLEETINRKGGICLMSGVAMPFEYIRSEGKACRMGVRLMAIVADGKDGRVYLHPMKEMAEIARQAVITWKPDGEIPKNPRDFKTPNYGMNCFADLFTSRQLVALTTLSDLIGEAHEKALKDATLLELPKDSKRLDARGKGAQAYADAVAVYLSFALSKQADLANSLCRWEPVAQCPRQLFGRQAIPMIWDFAESNPLGSSSGSWEILIENICKSFTKSFANARSSDIGSALQKDASTQNISKDKVISTDPPYYDNIGYADLSDFFYIWLRHSLHSVFPLLFRTPTVPKTQELVATPYRHGDKQKAETFFLEGMTHAMHRLAEQTHPAFPVTIYYAFKQSESTNESGTISTGWETFLEAVIRAGFALTGTIPMQTENASRMIGMDTNALASSIVLVCRPRCPLAPTITRREFLTHLRRELPQAIAYLKRDNIAAVDLRQAAIGPGMEVLTRYTKVIDAVGNTMTVREALSLINQIIDESQTEHESELDDATRWALGWFEDHGFSEGTFGEAEKLSTSTNVSVDSLVKFGLAHSKAGKVRLLKPDELPDEWDPQTRSRITVWEVVHQIIRALNRSEIIAANLIVKLGSKADAARDLAYRLFDTCEKKKRAQDALAYNALVQSWPEIKRLSQQRRDKQEIFI